jgi:hypothetical protein
MKRLYVNTSERIVILICSEVKEKLTVSEKLNILMFSPSLPDIAHTYSVKNVVF